MNSLNRIKLLPAREQVASVLRKAILTKEINEGEEMTLEGVATQVGVSSMPVREAFQILDSEGLIKLRPNRGAVVLGINEKTIKDHYVTRAILESEAAAMASEEGVDISDIENAYHTAEETMANNDVTNYGDLNQSFHFSIWEAAGNEKIISILSSMWNGLSMGRLVTKADYAKVSIKEHTQIIEAIQSHDGELAKRLMYEHIMRSLNDILTHF